MHKILVPMDNSENARRALEYALKVAREAHDAELLIVNAHEEPIVYGAAEIYLTTEEARDLQRQHSEDILQLANELATAAGVRFATRILIGNVPHEIVAAAEAEGCDCIVMGTRGMGAIASLLMGSVATKVVHLAKVPVTLVK